MVLAAPTSACARRFDIDDNRRLQIGIGKESVSLECSHPLRSGIGTRDELGLDLTGLSYRDILAPNGASRRALANLRLPSREQNVACWRRPFVGCAAQSPGRA
jgi:hypothetical protein